MVAFNSEHMTVLLSKSIQGHKDHKYSIYSSLKSILVEKTKMSLTYGSMGICKGSSGNKCKRPL